MRTLKLKTKVLYHLRIIGSVKCYMALIVIRIKETLDSPHHNAPLPSEV